MVDMNRHFVEQFANPERWLNAADNLNEQAIVLKGTQRWQGYTTSVDRGGKVISKLPATNKSVFLLGGFALENAIKAFLVYENPTWVSNGRLSRSLKNHDLTRLQRYSKFIPYKRRYRTTLREFEICLESWARYPCGGDVHNTEPEAEMKELHWERYTLLMRAYGRQLTKLLGKGWNGPHGFYGRWHFSGNVLGYEASDLPQSFAKTAVTSRQN